SNTPPDSYSAASHFGGVTDWYQEPRYYHVGLCGFHGTYTTVSSPYVVRSGDVSPGEDGPPVMPEDPYAYVVAAFQALPEPDYVPGPEELEQAPPSPPLPAATSPTTDSPGYIPESDPDEDPEDDDDEDLKEDPADYPTDHDDDDDEEEEHLASADSIPPPPALRVTAMISFRPHPPTLSFTKEDAERLSIVHRPGYEAGESSVVAAARPIEGRRVDYGFVGSVEVEIRRRIAEDIVYGIRDAWIDPRDIAEGGSTDDP
nr:hypothetical protein [Tanacetum cinerariifolium]